MSPARRTRRSISVNVTPRRPTSGSISPAMRWRTRSGTSLSSMRSMKPSTTVSFSRGSIDEMLRRQHHAHQHIAGPGIGRLKIAGGGKNLRARYRTPHQASLKLRGRRGQLRQAALDLNSGQPDEKLLRAGRRRQARPARQSEPAWPLQIRPKTWRRDLRRGLRVRDSGQQRQTRAERAPTFRHNRDASCAREFWGDVLLARREEAPSESTRDHGYSEFDSSAITVTIWPQISLEAAIPLPQRSRISRRRRWRSGIATTQN